MRVNFFNTAKEKIDALDEHTSEVLKKSSASLVVKIFGMIISFLVSIALGRLLGADGLGIINLSTQIVTMLLTFGLLGMQQVIVKEIAIAHNRNNLSRIGAVMNTAYLINGGISLLISVPLIFLSPWIATTIFDEPRLSYPLMISLVVLPPQIFSRILSSGLIGFRKIWQSNLVDQTLSISITGLILLILWYSNSEITILKVAIIYAIGKIAVTLSIGIYWNTLFKNTIPKKIIPRKLIKTALPLFYISIAAVVISSGNTLILGWLGNTSQVGLFTVATRLAFLSSFLLQITNSSVAPKLAALFESGQLDEMEKMVQQVTKGLLIIAALPLLIFLGGGEYILEFWGSEFSEAFWILIILSLGQLVNLSTGAVGLIMIMSGHERIQSRISMSFAILSLCLNFLMIYFYGAIGAAIGTATILAGSNILKVIYVKKLLGINTLPFKL